MAKPITEVPGIGPATAAILVESGISSAEELAAQTVAQIASINTFSEIRAARVINAAKALLAEEVLPLVESTKPEKKAAKKNAPEKEGKNKPKDKVKAQKKDQPKERDTKKDDKQKKKKKSDKADKKAKKSEKDKKSKKADKKTKKK